MSRGAPPDPAVDENSRLPGFPADAEMTRQWWNSVWPERRQSMRARGGGEFFQLDQVVLHSMIGSLRQCKVQSGLKNA